MRQCRRFQRLVVNERRKQIAFVHKIINHIEKIGYMENVAELTKPPFDKPVSFIKLFDAKTRTFLLETIE